MELFDYEKKHLDYCLENAHEGTLFLKRDDCFPLKKPCTVALFGNGARKTVKGGTGSGDVASRFFVSFEEGLEKAGFVISTKKWLGLYDAFREATEKDYIKDTKKAARKAHIIPCVYSMGYFEEEKDYPFSPEGEGDICVYVLARNSGEGNDRRLIKGDVYLSDREVKDILYLNEKFTKFILVLNVGGVIDLSPVKEVKNILYISQLGAVTGDVLPRILLGIDNPSGKLSSTWAHPEDYPYFEQFGDLHDTYYREGIYVGYRYFDTAEKEVAYPFGYGLSYTSFSIETISKEIDYPTLSLQVKVKNVGSYAGKEVVQAYLSCPSSTLDKPYQSLAAFKKTSLLEPGEEETISLKFDIRDSSSYDEEKAMYFLDQGEYVVRVGNSSRNTSPVCKFALDSRMDVKSVKNVLGDPGFAPFAPKATSKKVETETLPLVVKGETIAVTYQKDDYVEDALKILSNEELALLTLGHHGHGFSAIVGSSCEHVVGGAGETALCVKGVEKSLTMADGPAGLRIKTYGKDKKGIYDITADPLMVKMAKFLPKLSSVFMLPPKNRHGEIFYQCTTAIPIGTSLAMSFNLDYCGALGSLVAEEMERFNVDLWLAPALNIHRNILCGRNFEYFSEDPYLSGMIASAITRGVQSHPGRGVTIKHFAANNQELNRNNNNSHVSERAMREIYLRGFEICIRESNPLSIMTSYNLLNGIHTSECYGLINDILRCEWGYQGLVMTDWIASGRNFCSASIYPAPYASKNILAGNDLTMSGSPADERDIKKALKKGSLTRADLLRSASRIYRSIYGIKK